MKHKGQKLIADDRLTLQACIAKKMKVKDIADRLKVHISTVYRELEKNATIKSSPIKCYKLKNSSDLCNNCNQKNYCTKEKHYYNFTYANNISYVTNPILKNICCEETVRRLCYKGYLTAKASQLPRYVRYSRKYLPNKQQTEIKNIAKYDGRTYSDYQDVIAKNSRLSVVQFDSVVGKLEDEKAILTVTIVKYRFQFGILYNKYNGSNEINQKLLIIFKKLGLPLSRKIFAICLADNGIEFSKFSDLENKVPGIRTFYTNTYRATDKPHCERNHEFIRYISQRKNIR